MATWLKVDGYVLLGLVIFLYLISFISLCYETVMSYLLLGYGCIVILMGFFRLAWVIVGAILFWGSLSTYECSESLKVICRQI